MEIHGTQVRSRKALELPVRCSSTPGWHFCQDVGGKIIFGFGGKTTKPTASEVLILVKCSFFFLDLWDQKQRNAARCFAHMNHFLSRHDLHSAGLVLNMGFFFGKARANLECNSLKRSHSKVHGFSRTFCPSACFFWLWYMPNWP